MHDWEAGHHAHESESIHCEHELSPIVQGSSVAAPCAAVTSATAARVRVNPLVMSRISGNFFFFFFFFLSSACGLWPRGAQAVHDFFLFFFLSNLGNFIYLIM
jgi:hypothetical protein